MRPGSVFSNARLTSDAVAQANGRAEVQPVVAAAESCGRRDALAFRRLMDPLADLLLLPTAPAADGDLEMETTAFDELDVRLQLPTHPGAQHITWHERGGRQAARELPRLDAARGAIRALPVYKFLAREKLKVASLAQQRKQGAAALHTMLRAHAAALSSLALSAVDAGVLTPAQLTDMCPQMVYTVLCTLFANDMITMHCRKIEDAVERRGLKPATLHSHFSHLANLAMLADGVSPKLAGTTAKAASAAGVRSMLQGKARLQRRDAKRERRGERTVQAAVAECGALPRAVALESLRATAERTVVLFGDQVRGLPAPLGATVEAAVMASVAIGVMLSVPRAMRLADLQCATFKHLVRKPDGGGSFDVGSLDGKVGQGAFSGFEQGAASDLPKNAAAALRDIEGWLPAGEAPLMFDAQQLFADANREPSAALAPLAGSARTHRVLYEQSGDLRTAADERCARLDVRVMSDARALAALRAVCGERGLWVSQMPAWPRTLHDATWRWLRRWALTAHVERHVVARSFCGVSPADHGAHRNAAARAIARYCGTSVAEMFNSYLIGGWPLTCAVPLAVPCSDMPDASDEASGVIVAKPSASVVVRRDCDSSSDDDSSSSSDDDDDVVENDDLRRIAAYAHEMSECGGITLQTSYSIAIEAFESNRSIFRDRIAME